MMVFLLAATTSVLTYGLVSLRPEKALTARAVRRLAPRRTEGALEGKRSRPRLIDAKRE